jgi:hypothetical protein
MAGGCPSNCHYLIFKRGQCGWLGDTPPQPGTGHCNFKPDENRVPEGLAIARSSRVVPIDQLKDENAAHSEQVGASDYSGF